MKPRDQFGLDALLGRWPAQDPQEHGGPSWEERAEKISAAALASREQGAPEVIGALLAPPGLEPEPGEEAGARGFDVVGPAQSASGNGSMRGSERAETGGATHKMSSDQGKRPSLKELAARASQAGAARPSVSSMPPPLRSSAPPVPATVTPIAKARAARDSASGKDDSGVLRLADLQKPAAADAATAAPMVVAAARPAAASTTVATATAASSGGGGSRTGMWAGAAIAVLGIAAAFAVYQTRKPEPQMADATAAPPATSAPVVAEAPSAQPAAEPTAVASAAPADTADPAAEADPAGQAGGTAAPAAVAVNDVKAAAPTKDAVKGSKVGTLDEEMKKAVGANDLPAAPQDDGSKPAAGGSSSVPEQPSQGNAQAAIRAVVGGARACVAGAPESSSASVTFSSSGAVQSVSVGGWAAANGKTGCVKSALQGAHVSPFAKPSYTVPVTIRP